jgi:DNA-binding NarL/FixJ family response regulator
VKSVGVPNVPIRVLLADDHQTVLWGLEQLIQSAAPRMTVVGQVNSRTALFEMLRQITADLVLLDLDLGGSCALDFIPELIRQSFARVLILTGSTDPASHQQAVVSGARGVVSKLEPAAVLLTAIDRVSAGEIWLDRLSLSRVLDIVSKGARPDLHRQRFESLTPKERQIVASVLTEKGARNKVIADKLNMSEHTLRNRLTTIYSKLCVDGRMALYLYATSHFYRLQPMTNVPIGRDT